MYSRRFIVLDHAYNVHICLQKTPYAFETVFNMYQGWFEIISSTFL